jgi:hypothetical protein
VLLQINETDLENVSVQLLCRFALKRQLQATEHVSQALHSQAHRPVPHVAPLRRRNLRIQNETMSSKINGVKRMQFIW